MIATTTSDIIYVSIALIMMFVSGYILGTTDEMGREKRRKEKLRRKREQRKGGEKTLRKLSLRLDMRIYNWAEEYGTTVSEYLEHAVYSALEFGGSGFQFDIVRVVPKYDTSVYLTDKTFKEVKKLAKQNNLSKAQILNRSAVMFHVRHLKESE